MNAITLWKGNVSCIQSLLEECGYHYFTHAQITKKPEIGVVGWLCLFCLIVFLHKDIDRVCFDIGCKLD